MFFKYLLALNASPVQNRRVKYYPLMLGSYLFFIFFVMATAQSFGFVNYAAFIILIASMGISVSRRLSPSLLKLLPISRKRRLAYDFCSVLFLSAVAIAMVALLALAIMLIVAACLGPSSFSEIQTDLSQFNAARGGTYYDVIFSAAFVACIYFGEMACSYFKEDIKYIISNVCFIVLLAVAMLCTCLPYFIKYGYFGGEEYGSFLINEFFAVMTMPWLALSLWCAAAAALAAAAVYLGIRHYYKPNV